MIPWRSGNSPTMWVRRSHLPSSAAPGSILHREVTLVVRERRDQHFPRQREEALLEAPRERHRPLGERRHLIEERGGDERAAARVRRRGRDLGPDALAARRQIREHTA